MRIRTGFSVMLLSVLACVGVPSAAVGDLVPTPASTSEAAATTGAAGGAPTPEPSDAPATESTAPAAADTAAPTQDGAEPDVEEAPGPAAEGAVEPTDAAGQTEPAVEVVEPAAEEVTRDPRASIGDVSCPGLTVPVILDNSRSTSAVTYLLLAGDMDGEDYTLTRKIMVPAETYRHLDVPVTEDALFIFDISDGGDPPQAGQLAWAVLTVDCDVDDPHDPQARIGNIDCDSMTVGVTLDNSRSVDTARYLVTHWSPFEGGSYTERTVDVAAGGVETVLVPVTENTAVDVYVEEGVDEEEDGTFLASELFRVNCTTDDEPRASFGAVRCSDLTVAVTLDNTRSPSPTTFVVLAGALEGDDYFDDYVSVPAGAERAAHVRVPDNAEVTLIAADEAEYWELSATLAWETREVDCARVLSRRAVPRAAANVGVLAATGTNGLPPLFVGLGLLVSGGVLTLLGPRRRPTI